MLTDGWSDRIEAKYPHSNTISDWGDFNYKDRGKRGALSISASPPRPTITAVDFETDTYYTTSTFISTIVVDPTKTVIKTRTEVETNYATAAKIRPTPASAAASVARAKETQAVSVSPGKTEYLSLGSNIYGLVETVLETSTIFSTDGAGNVTPSQKVATQVYTSLTSLLYDFPTQRIKREESDSPDEGQFQKDESGGRNLQLSREELLALKSSFLAAQGQQQQSRYKRDVEADSRDERQFQTKLFGDVEVVIKGKFPARRKTATP